jgi:predicted  nucleic acid-binding Zn-ribbon protein
VKDVDKALDAYANALTVAVVDGGSVESPSATDRRVAAARAKLVELQRNAGDAAAWDRVADLEKELRATKKQKRALERQLERVRKAVA